jgi:fructose-specific phosphotransferase system IIC component
MKISRMRGIISTILIISAVLSLSTGAILYFLHYGIWLCFTRNFINNVHAVSGLIMGCVVIVHFVVNRKMYWQEMKNLFL